jgi:hypothetical protein
MAGVPGAGPGTLTQLAPFRTYLLDQAHDEMFDARGLPRPHYAAVFDRLLTLDPQELKQRQSAADLAFLHQGITFTVYGQKEGTERIFPYDLIPRILTALEWEVIERGLTQRLQALNLFLKDIYIGGQHVCESHWARGWCGCDGGLRCRASGGSCRHNGCAGGGGRCLRRDRPAGHGGPEPACGIDYDRAEVSVPTLLGKTEEGVDPYRGVTVCCLIRDQR